MKKILVVSLTSFLFASCGGGDKKENDTKTPAQDSAGSTAKIEYFGEKITEDNAMSMTDFMAGMGGNDSMQVKLTATINECCQKKGCWMMVDMGNGEEMRVKFKDYGFFVPKDAAGKTVIIEGWAYADTLTVEGYKHYLEDAGASQEEIDAVTEPKAEWSFMANGVIIKDEK